MRQPFQLDAKIYISVLCVELSAYFFRVCAYTCIGQRVVCCFLLLFQEVEPEGVSPCPTYVLSPNSDCPLSDSSNSVSVGCGCLSYCIFSGYSLFLIPILFLLYCLTHNVLCIFRNILFIISFTIKRPKHKATKKAL